MRNEPFRISGVRPLGEFGFLRAEELQLDTPSGSFTRIAIRHPGAVAVVAVTDGAVLLIRQFRATVASGLLEIPAGKLDVIDEDPEVTAGRELEEEVGFRAGRIEHVFDFYTAPGFTDEHMRLYFASGLLAVPATPHGPEEEAAEIVSVPLDDLPALLGSGEVKDAKTLIGLQWLLLKEQ